MCDRRHVHAGITCGLFADSLQNCSSIVGLLFEKGLPNLQTELECETVLRKLLQQFQDFSAACSVPARGFRGRKAECLCAADDIHPHTRRRAGFRSMEASHNGIAANSCIRLCFIAISPSEPGVQQCRHLRVMGVTWQKQQQALYDTSKWS